MRNMVNYYLLEFKERILSVLDRLTWQKVLGRFNNKSKISKSISTIIENILIQ